MAAPLLPGPENAPRKQSWIARSSWLRDPLLHFLLLGGSLFALDRLLHRPDEIRVTTGVRSELEQELSARLGRKAAPAETERALDHWKLEEALYREGLKRALDRDDSLVRARVIKKLRSQEAALWLPDMPSEAELRVWFEAHRDLYEVPARYDFEQFLAEKPGPGAELRAQALAAELQQGASLAERAFEVAAPQKVRGWTRAEVESSFGADFARGISALMPGQWTVLSSLLGHHAVRVELVEGGLASYEQSRARLIADLQRAERERFARRAEAEILGAYRFVEEPP